MKLKYSIKEVVDTQRMLTVEEQCMLSKSQSTCGGMLTVMATDKLRKLGFVKIVSNSDIGIFRTQTTRDATPEEVIAWLCIQIQSRCNYIAQCDGCPKCGCCNGNEGQEYTKSKEILEGKKVIVEVVE